VQDTGLYEHLRQLRMELAQQQNVPPYVIFSNATLEDMANRQPYDLGGLLQVSGVGEVKAQRYGAAFLKAIEEWQQEQKSE
jgi:ATP-dependent DNA helicase RecQ